MNPSLWMATSEWPDFPPLDTDISLGALVVGSGITGLTAARLLAGEGVEVGVIDSGRLCSGVTGFTTAKLSALQSTVYTELSETWGDEVAAVYASSNLWAIDQVRRLVAEDRIDCDFQDEPAYTYAESDEHLGRIEAEVDAASRAGLDVSFTVETDLPYPIAGAVRLADQARFHPRRYCRGLLDATVGRGGVVFENTRALSLDADAGTVVTDRGTVTADLVIVATHLPFGNLGGYFARTSASRSYAVAFAQDSHPLEGMYISVDEPIRSLRSTGDGYTIVGGENHPVGEDEDTTRRYQALEEWCRERLGSGPVEHRWSAQDYRSADGLPFIGPLGSSGKSYLATGFAKWGMTNGTIAASIMVDLALGRDNPWAEVFDSRRMAARQALPETLKVNAKAAGHFVGGRITSSSLSASSLPGPGHGDVVSHDDERLAVFQGEDGEVSALSPYCTHLGCVVGFNTAEQTWDCPCHGSRFDLDGRVIHGPAVEDLAPVAMEADKEPTG
ncbi:MAG TPA: FAD-dependent oxidoreductase [Acidimicrobiia bacterium]|nr:FAD-dependent oxidoreductase [Acidimicrobiia bacterium]